VPWRPVFMRAYMVLLARLMRSSILISFSFISDLIIPRCNALLVGQISDSPKVHSMLTLWLLWFYSI
jgi:hypothetical protein